MYEPVSIDLQRVDGGVILPVKAQPGARRDALTGEHDRALKVAVAQAPEKGKANKALVQVLARDLGLRKSQIELASGATSTHKRFLIRDVTVEVLDQRIQQALNAS